MTKDRAPLGSGRDPAGAAKDSVPYEQLVSIDESFLSDASEDETINLDALVPDNVQYRRGLFTRALKYASQTLKEAQ